MVSQPTSFAVRLELLERAFQECPRLCNFYPPIRTSPIQFAKLLQPIINSNDEKASPLLLENLDNPHPFYPHKRKVCVSNGPHWPSRYFPPTASIITPCQKIIGMIEFAVDYGITLQEHLEGHIYSPQLLFLTRNPATVLQ